MYGICAVLLVILFSVEAQYKIDVQKLRCLVCKASIDELDDKIKHIDPDNTIDIGGYRIDSEGNFKQQSVSLAKSEIHISELIEDICMKMEDYIRGTWKSNGTLTIFKIISEGGGMNPVMSEIDIIQDDDLNKSLKYYCEEIMEIYEDAIVSLYKSEVKDVGHKICYEEALYCDRNQEKEGEEADFVKLRDEF